MVKISRRGKPVAVLRQDETVAKQAGVEATGALRTLCQKKMPIAEIIALPKAGRER